jgi:branched-chain amino acid transport system ATP-binding protein
MSALDIEGVGMNFGGVAALGDVSLSVERGEILAVVGPNGAGKTTLLDIVSGLCVPRSGRIRVGGIDVTGQPAHRIARQGVSRTFQHLRIFHRMTAVENVMAASRRRGRRPAMRARALAMLARAGLRDVADHHAVSLPYGALRRLEIVRALAREPKVLLLDEPGAGCNGAERSDIGRLIRAVAADGVAIVMVERDLRLVADIASRALVLDRGRMLTEGQAADIRANPDVVAAYFGMRDRGETGLARG